MAKLPARRSLWLLPLLLLVAVLVGRALSMTSRQLPPAPPTAFAVDAQGAAGRLARSLTFATVSRPGQPPGGAPLDGLHAFLAQAYPRVHTALAREQVSEHATLYRWPGREPGRAPLLLLAHLDVVPVEPGTEASWRHDPFGGVIDDGFVWGRGAIDDKASAIALMEAIELLLAQGFTPRGPVLLGLGADEEIGGQHGAQVLARVLAERGTRPRLVLDEGLSITEGVLQMVARPVAMVGVAEKGYLSLELTAATEGGHSSMPPPQTNVGILAAAIARLEREQMPASLDGPAGALLDTVGPETALGSRLVLANRWLLGPLVLRSLAGTPSGNATVRTTTAPTMFEGSVKDNVLPARARAVVNFRIRPGDTIEAVEQHVRRVIGDPRVSVRPLDETRSNPSPVSSTTSAGFQLLARTIRQRFPQAVVTPALVLGATDSRHYQQLGADTYRFTPFRVTPSDLPRIHGKNERIAVSHFADGVGFYAQLLVNADGLE